MLRQLLNRVLYELVICVTLVLAAKNGLLESGHSSKPCQFPEIQMPYFDNENPTVIALNSRGHLKTDIKIPFQYILMGCSASYPVEWIGNIPKHYYFSYVLDDELRSIVRSNETLPDDQQNDMDRSTANNGHQTEKFTVRLHIGNETFAKPGFTNISVACKPVDNTSDCGKIQVNVMKYDEGLHQNSAMLSVRFSDLPLATSVIDVPETEKLNCSTKEKFMQIQEFLLNSTAQLKTTEYKLPDSTLPESDHTPQLNSIMRTSLLPRNGTSACADNSNQSTMPHFAYTSVNESDIVSLNVQNASTNEIYVGQNVTVTCTSSIHLFAKGMRILLLSTIDENGFGNTVVEGVDIGVNATERAFGIAGFRNITTSFIVANKTNQEIKCSAPVRRSRAWVTKSEIFHPKVPVRVTFQQVGDIASVDGSSGLTYLICNASGDPLPTLTWSRLNDEKLPNQTGLETGKMFNSSLSWVSSKLYFPDTHSSVIADYYGRYICIARNRFMSLEKPFLFDEKTGQKDSLVFDGNDIFSGEKAVWFWIIIAFALLMLLGTVSCLGWKLRKQAQNVRLFTRDEIDEFIFGKPDYLLDNSDEYEQMNTYAAYLPYDRQKFEISRDQLEFCAKDVIGSGAYGTVYKGLFKGEEGTVVPVAIKTVNPASDKAYFAALLSEIKIMCYIGKHGNLVELVGSVTKYLDQRQIFVAMEYCPNGDLLSYIWKHRQTFINNADFESKRENAPKNWVKTPGSNGYCRLAYGRLILSPHLLLVWALQITQGMTYLSSKKVIHGDLAARNILLAGDLKPKIADFGLSNQLQNYSNYVRKGDDLVPWRWLAVECLQFMKFSVQSDVWAFGVLLYELFSLGQVPFGNHTYSELFIVSICHGERLQRPQFASEKLYGIMMDCWKHCPEDRPSFQSLQDEFKNMCADSEQKMIQSMSRAQVNSDSEVQQEPKSNHSKPPSYINNLDPIHAEENIITEKKRNEEPIKSIQNGYVTEVEPLSTCHQLNHKIYVNPEQLPPSEITFTAPQQLTYIDWNGVR